MEKLTCAKAKQIDLVGFLASIGHQPQKVRKEDYWYLSPLRDERTASFKVDRKLGLWYDHGLGIGGDIIDFGTRYFRCGVSDLLTRLTQNCDADFLSFQPHILSGESHLPALSAGEKKEENRIKIIAVRDLSQPSLTGYIDERGIPFVVAERHCKEVDFELYGRQYTAIGFPNNAGGFELRSADFKGSSSPKSIRFVENCGQLLAVFEGFFNYLSYETLRLRQSPLVPDRQPDILVLNSLSFFEKSRSLMDRYGQVSLYLDRDTSGIRATRLATSSSSRYIDKSNIYANYNDLNEFLTHRRPLKQKRRLGRGL